MQAPIATRYEFFPVDNAERERLEDNPTPEFRDRIVLERTRFDPERPDLLWVITRGHWQPAQMWDAENEVWTYRAEMADNARVRLTHAEAMAIGYRLANPEEER